MGIELKITDGPNLCFNVSSIKLSPGAGTGTPGEAPTAQNIGDIIAAAESKTTLVDADSIGVSNSEGGDILVGFNYARLKAQLTTLFNLIYQPLSTALSKITESGGLPLWDGAAWPGGGGSDWELIEDRAMTTNLVELFTVGANDKIKFELENYGWDGADSFPYFALSLDGGSTYSARHYFVGHQNHSDAVTTISGIGGQLQNQINLSPFAFKLKYNATLEFTDITTDNTRFKLFKSSFLVPSAFRLHDIAGSGWLSENSPVTTVKFFNSVNTPINLGRIKLSKYVGD